MNADTGSPLQGLRVLEIANWLAVPAAAAMLADMGADVVKIEPPQGDAWRGFRLDAVYPGSFPMNYAFALDNRGKRSVVLDFGVSEARDVVMKLVDSADVLLTNLVPERRQRYGLTYQQVSARNPRIIYLGFSGYGSEGPDRDRLGFDYAAFWARSGIMGLIGEPDAPPSPQRPGMGDHSTAPLLVSGVLAALLARERTGRGQEVSGSLLNTGLWVLGTDVQATLVSRQSPQRVSRTQASNPLWNTYQCRDAWLMLVMPQPDPYWPAMCAAIDRPELAGDPRFATFDARRANARDLVTLFEAAFLSETRAEWGHRLDRHGLIWAPVQQLADVVEDPQVQANGFFTTVDHPTHGPYQTIGLPLKFSESDVQVRGPAPEIGQHTEEVLLEAGHP